jgi:hypothetical protein
MQVSLLCFKYFMMNGQTLAADSGLAADAAPRRLTSQTLAWPLTLNGQQSQVNHRKNSTQTVTETNEEQWQLENTPKLAQEHHSALPLPSSSSWQLPAALLDSQV